MLWLSVIAIFLKKLNVKQLHYDKNNKHKTAINFDSLQ